MIGSNAVTAYPVFAPCGNNEKNPASQCRAKVKIARFPFDDFDSEIQWMLENDLLSFLRQDVMMGHVADIRVIPIELNLRRIHVLS